jgi:prevent-host-death family protein
MDFVREKPLDFLCEKDYSLTSQTIRRKQMEVQTNAVRVWQLQEAKARLSEVIKLAGSSPQTITVHGKETAVILSMDQYRKITQPEESLYDALQSLPFQDLKFDFERDRSAAMREIDLGD